ncbi:MAG: hypothetical protein U5R31_16770 [Acidimicrobiia bacterium]|nr:hypothetical protein [Acidimicrobiia bacterium]
MSHASTFATPSRSPHPAARVGHRRGQRRTRSGEQADAIAEGAATETLTRWLIALERTTLACPADRSPRTGAQTTSTPALDLGGRCRRARVGSRSRTTCRASVEYEADARALNLALWHQADQRANLELADFAADHRRPS